MMGNFYAQTDEILPLKLFEERWNILSNIYFFGKKYRLKC